MMDSFLIPNILIGLKQLKLRVTSLAPSQRGLSAKLTGECRWINADSSILRHSLHRLRGPPPSMREARGTRLFYDDKHYP